MLTNEELTTQAKADIVRAWREQSDWRQRARKSYEYEGGKQWRKEDQERLTDKLHRAAFTFNRIRPMIKAVVGMEMGNRQEIKCTPREPGDNGVSTVFDLSIAWVRDLGGLAEEESDSWRDLLISGLGVTETAMDYSDGPDGKILVERISPLDAFYDPDATRRNLRDARFKGRLIPMTKDAFARKWPDFPIDEAKGTVFGVEMIDTMTQPHNNDPKMRYNQGPGTTEPTATASKKVIVAKYEYCTFDPMYYVENPMNAGAMEQYDEEKFEAIREDLEKEGWEFYERGVAGPPESGRGIGFVKLDHKRWYVAYFCGDQLVEDPAVNPDPNQGTIHFMTGEREETTGHFIGLVEGAQDPQSLLNKTLSAMVDSVNFGSKDKLWAKRRAFANWDDAQESYARNDKMGELSEEFDESMLYKSTPAQMPSGMPQILEIAINGLPAVTGINYESIGTANKDQPGILEQTRKQSAMATLSGYFDALRVYRVASARTIMFFIKNYLEPKTLARICGQNATPEGIQAVAQADVLDYDIVVGDAPNNPNQRDATLKVLLDVIQYAPEAAKVLMPLMVPSLPLPEPMLLKMEAALNAANQKSPEEQIAEKVMLEKALAEIEKIKAEAQAALAKADAAYGGTEVKAGKLQLDEAKLKIDALSDQLKFVTDLVKAKASMEKKDAGRTAK